MFPVSGLSSPFILLFGCSLTLRVKTGLTVVIPGSYKINDIPDLLRKKERWILDKLAKYVKGHPITEGKEPKSGDFIPYLGRHLKVVTRHNLSFTGYEGIDAAPLSFTSASGRSCTVDKFAVDFLLQ